jgi:hypothetical protein
VPHRLHRDVAVGRDLEQLQITSASNRDHHHACTPPETSPG